MITSDDAFRLLCRIRDIETPCEVCHGFGARMYGSTSTWRGGMGGASMTTDVCDKCWGSGDATKPWTDLRKLRNEETTRVHQRAADLFAHRCGVEFKSLAPALQELVGELHKFERQRRPRPRDFDLVTRCLANLLDDLLKAQGT